MGSFGLGLAFSLYYVLLTLAVLLIPPTTGVSINITVDDTFGNSDGSVIPTYLPANDTIWHVGSPSEQCDYCSIQPSMLNTSQILDQSWHHAVYGKYIGIPVLVQITFSGTAVYVYNVLPNTLPTGSMLVNISFALDGETVGEFSRVPDSSSEILYHQLVYANASLSDSVHTLVMSASGSEPSLIFFDYLLYTTEAKLEGTTSNPATATSPAVTTTSDISASSAHPPTAAIAGGVVGGVAVLLMLLFLASSRLRRRHRQTLARPLTARSDSTVFGDAATPELFSRPISAGPSSNVATIAGPSLPFFESKREAELRRRNEMLQHREMAALPSSQRPLHCQEQRSESDLDISEGLGSSTVQALHGEIAALRDVLQSAMAARAGLHNNQPAMSEVLPGYEEADGLVGLRDWDRGG